MHQLASIAMSETMLEVFGGSYGALVKSWLLLVWLWQYHSKCAAVRLIGSLCYMWSPWGCPGAPQTLLKSLPGAPRAPLGRSSQEEGDGKVKVAEID